MHYGVFIQNVFDFLIVAFAIFMAIKLINKLNRKKEEPAAAPAPTKEEVLLSEIRDLLKEQNNRVLIKQIKAGRPVVNKRFAFLPLASQLPRFSCLSFRSNFLSLFYSSLRAV